MAAVQQNGRALELVSERLKKSRRIVKAAVRRFPPALKFASKDLKQDPGCLIAAGLRASHPDEPHEYQYGRSGHGIYSFNLASLTTRRWLARVVSDLEARLWPGRGVAFSWP